MEVRGELRMVSAIHVFQLSFCLRLQTQQFGCGIQGHQGQQNFCHELLYHECKSPLAEKGCLRKKPIHLKQCETLGECA